ncbi:MAG: AAA family ATPase [Proteobacteria bacterium]|nr:AAA family ATPase [Pseudomonadota bacterium]
MYRKQLDILQEWWNSKRRKPLVIRGARQVGKSTLVQIFAKDAGLDLNEVNLDRFPELDAVFATKDPARIIAELDSLPNMPGISESSLLFVDEIQGAEHALPALRYFYEDRPGLPVIAAGSLLEFTLRQHHFSMPVGRIDYLHMGPMVFSDFLLAMGEDRLAATVKTFTLGSTIGAVAHKRLNEWMRSYFFVGGMPEAVERFARSRQHRHASDVHRSIIGTYRDDFPKYIGARDLVRIIKVFTYAARSVGKKVKYTNFSADHQGATIRGDIDLLCLARILTKVVSSSCNGVPLEAESDQRVYKLLFLDVGLMNSVLGLKWSDISAVPDIRLSNEGTMAEQFVGQHLLDAHWQQSSGDLSYWLREGKGTNAEVDFVISAAGQVVPIEVKSAAAGSLRSLHQMMSEKQLPLAIRFDLNPPGAQEVATTIRSGPGQKNVRYDLLSLPLYLVERSHDAAEQYYADRRSQS